MAALVGLTAGIGGVLLFSGLFAVVVAALATIRGRVGWAHLTTRASGVAALVGAVVTMAVGAAVSPSTVSTAAPPSVDRTGSPPARSSAPTTPETDPVGTAISQARPGTALAVIGTLKVKGRGPMTGYSRAAFGAAWADTDRNGCDQRNDTLRRDLQAVTLKAGTNGCTVMTGTLADPYTATTVPFTRATSSASPVQIDHVVALADAWVKGASDWPQAKRTSFANDTLNLVAVSARVNSAKGAGDAATWLPPAKAYRCAYVARQVAVKARYELAVTSAERSAAVAVLTGCATTRVPTVAVPELGGFPLYAATTPASAPATVQGVHPGAFCSPQGARGHTSKGTLMQCSSTSGDSRARWRSA